MGAEPGDVLVLRPSRKAFSQPFCKFVSDVLAAHPGVPVFKVVPPRGYAPRSAAYPPLEDVTIGVPIKQHVRGPPAAAFPPRRPCARGPAPWPAPSCTGRPLAALLPLIVSASHGRAPPRVPARARACASGGLRRRQPARLPVGGADAWGGRARRRWAAMARSGASLRSRRCAGRRARVDYSTCGLSGLVGARGCPG